MLFVMVFEFILINIIIPVFKLGGKMVNQLCITRYVSISIRKYTYYTYCTDICIEIFG